jgi:hypothetical protein
MSQEGKKDNQRQQPPETLTVHTATIQTAKSVQVNQSSDRETEEQLLPQCQQTAKQQSLTQRGCCLHGDPITGHFGSLVTLNNATLNNATLIMFPYIAHIIGIYCILYHLLHFAYAARLAIYLYVHILTHPVRFVCIK